MHPNFFPFLLQSKKNAVRLRLGAAFICIRTDDFQKLFIVQVEYNKSTILLSA